MVKAMDTYRTEAVITKDRTLTLEDLPFQAGERVEVIVVTQAGPPAEGGSRPLRGTPVRYRDPFEPVAEADWESLT